MSRPGRAALAAAAESLREELAAATAAVPGVARFEPTLRNALRRLHAGTTVLLDGRSIRSAADGVALHRRGDVVDVHVDLVTDDTRPAVVTVREVRVALHDVLVAQQLVPGELTVAVLSIQR